MNDKNFTVEVTEEITKQLGNGYQVVQKNVIKNNGRNRLGICINQVGEKIAPTIYLDDFYEDYQNGTSVEKIAENIIKVFHECHANPMDFQIENLLKFQPDCIIPKLVNLEKNKDMLQSAPYTKWLDLAITYRILCNQSEDGVCSTLLTNQILQEWGKTKEEIHQIAFENMELIYPATVSKLSEVIAGMMECEGNEGEFGLSPDKELYVLTNVARINGATNLLTSNLVKEMAEHLKRDLIILPSSIHEFLLLPYHSGVSVQELNQMVKDINQDLVSEEEVLSDHIYQYVREENTFLLLEENCHECIGQNR